MEFVVVSVCGISRGCRGEGCFRDGLLERAKGLEFCWEGSRAAGEERAAHQWLFVGGAGTIDLVDSSFDCFLDRELENLPRSPDFDDSSDLVLDFDYGAFIGNLRSFGDDLHDIISIQPPI